MALIIDHRHDPSQKLLYVATEKLADKSFAKDAREMINIVSDQVKTAESVVYADSENSLFPVSSLEDVILSKLYFDAQREKLAEHQEVSLSEKIATYLELFSVPESLFEYVQEKEAQDTGAIAPRYLLPSLKLCKVASVNDLEKAASLFTKEAGKLEVSQRVEFASNFIKAATDLGSQEYPRSIAKYAGILDTDMENLQAMLEYRAAAASWKNMDGSSYLKLAFDLKRIDQPPTQNECVKLAETIHKLDEHLGFTDPEYDNKLPCAYSVVFNKEAVDTAGSDEPVPTKAEIVAKYGDGILEAVEDEEGNIDMDKLKQLRGTYESL
jgi:hypothetical protein